MRILSKAMLAVLALSILPLWAAAPKAGPASKPVSKAEKKRLLAEESAEQKTLREELGQLAAKGQVIYFNANIDGVQRIFKMDCSGSGIECLTPAPGAGGYHPKISLDGKRIAYSAPMKKEQVFKLIPKGDKYHKVADSSGTFLMSAKGGDSEPLAHGFLAHWSPDGKKLVYQYFMKRGKGKRIAIFDLESKIEHTIIHPGIKGGHFPTISPDGKYIYVAGRTGYVAPLNAAGTGLADDVKFVKPLFKYGCNEEFTKDGKLLTWVIDTNKDLGGWLCYAPFKPNKRVRVKKLPLGWVKGSVNYYPDFSPCGKYLIYTHAEQQSGVKSWKLTSKQELYVTRFPDCKATVRVSWNGAANMHPHWWGPKETGSTGAEADASAKKRTPTP